ncbi:hypothetical protein, partial [Streptomyces sp. NPDC047014]|uniref:DUF5691 domain-containing protein n=1 Tax=Streptomyces sp. NPDC047014 TaxID=3155736 RepID=UPI0033EA706E
MGKGDEGYGEWRELVGTALLGTDRRRGGGPAASPEALLDAAAVHTVRRRAGLLADEADALTTQGGLCRDN